MDRTRRNFLQGALLSAGVLATRRTAGAQNRNDTMQMPQSMIMDDGRMSMVHEPIHRMPPNHTAFLPVITPDVSDLPFEMDNGVKVFHLVAEPVKQELIPGKTVNLWGYNGSAPGPTIQAKQGDRVRHRSG